MGVSSALGDGCEETFAALLRGEPVLSAPPFELPFLTVTGLVQGPLDPLPASYRSYDTRLTRLALRALSQVTAQVEHARARHGRSRIGVVVGTSTGGLDATEPAYRAYRNTERHEPSFSLRRAHAFDALAVLLRDLLALSGPAYAVSTACTSSAKALASGLRLIRAGLCDAVLVAGVDAVCETTLRGFQALGVLSERAARPFSSERDGIHIGEAAALLLLERSGEGAVCLAAVGESSDAHSMSAPQPDGLGAAEAMQRALASAGLDPSQVDFVNAHGTGTVQNDIAESRAIGRAVSSEVAVVSTKGMTGHTLGAYGTLETLFTALGVLLGELPPSAGCAPLDTQLGLNVLQLPLAKRVQVALSNALAFGGSNACVVLTAS